MYLKQIEVENFKSFGKKMTIPMLDGFTAVTGPNGSGKSNISDAILFVLGPKSSKALRAGKLTDLIFNGGNSKQPSSYCKVSLVFDNKDRIIPVDSDIVRLTRHVKLSESEIGYNSYFYVNDRKSSLTEFDYLLSSARISADGYNLVQQGDVTRIVEMSPLERRRVLDDISGISKFDEDIIRADGERKTAEENMDRLGIIMAELEKHMKQLESEKAAAIKYMETRDRLALSKSRLAHKKREVAETEVNATRTQIDSYNKEIEGLKQKKLELAKKVTETDHKIEQLEKEILDKGGEEFRQMKERMDSAKIEIARATDTMQRSEEDLKELLEALKGRKEERSKLLQEVKGLEDKIKTTEAVRVEKQSLLDEKKATMAQVQERMSSFDGEISALEKKVTELDAQVKEGEERSHSMLLEKNRMEDRSGRLTSDIASLEESRDNLEFQVKDSEWRLKEVQRNEKSSTGEVTTLQAQFFAKRSQESKLSAQLEELENAIKSLTREYNHLTAEKEAAESVAKGYNRAVRSLLEARDRGEIKGIHGTVAELAKVDPQYEVALNVAAGARMQSIIVDDDEVASASIQYLKRNSLGRATFLPLSKMLDGKPRGKAQIVVKDAVGYAIDLIDFDDQYRAAFWYVFGDTVVVDTLDQARRMMGGVRLVTASGELIEASGAMVGGTVDTNVPRFGQSKKGKIEEVAEELRRSTEHSEKVAVQVKALRLELQQIEARMRELNGSGSGNEIKITGLEASLKEAKAKLTRAKDDIVQKTKDLGELKAAIDKLGREIGSLDSKVAVIREQRDAGKKRILELAPKDMSTKLRALQSEVVELTAEAAQLLSERTTMQTQVELIRKHLQEFDEFELETRQKGIKLKADGDEAKAKEAKLRIELNGLKRIEEAMGREMNELRAKKEGLFKDRTQYESDRDKVQTRVDTSQDFIITLTTKQAAALERIKECEVEIEQIQVPVTYPLPSMEDIRSEMNRCESTLASMGAVNLRSIEDYEQKGARHIEMKNEVKRLEDQRKDLIKLTTELNDKKKVALLKVFDGVNESFKKVYAELSQGGEAELYLEVPDKPFEGGLVMKCRPRNGKVLRLEALSGGEKSLAALSFIFAMQEWQPSPFYLLDEVDMFLDAVNADSVAQRVRKCASTAQFVMISLRKVTLNKADHIIGVTKPEGGISNIIVKPDVGDIKDLHEELKIPEEKGGNA
ncbi:MAG: chromosome segregation protein SMC [Euryarchaeota archaeon]|nr:chromosome segregation protein SMC [Euryarchaeota archaeon]